MRVLFLIITAICAYFLGGLNGAIITSRFFFHQDIREHGSGNAGLTNFHRTYGVAGIAMVLAIDVIKSVVAVLIGGALMNIVGEKAVGQIFAGFCLMMGHIFPAFYQFRGGKGVLCAGTLILMVDPVAGLCCWAAFIIVVVCTHYVSLASMIACLLGPVFLAVFKFSGLEVVLTLLCALLVVVKHAENILRLIGGTENKLSFGSKSPKK